MIRVGVLGTAGIAEKAMIEPAKEDPDFEVIRIGSRSAARAEDYALAHGVARSGSYEAVIDDPEVDLVYIALPPSLHAEWAIRALEAGKDVLCEKPMASNAAEAAEMWAAAQRSGRRLLEAYHYLHHPLAQRALEIIRSGRLGELTEAEGVLHVPSFVVQPGNIRLDSRLGGGVLMDAGCYPVHFLRTALGEPEVVGAVAETDGTDPQVDVRMTFDLRFPDGVVAHLQDSFLGGARAESVIRVTGTEGSLEAQFLPMPQWGCGLTITDSDGVHHEDAEPITTYACQLRHVEEVIRTGAPSPVDGSDSILTMGVIDDVYRAAGLRPRGTA